MKTLSLIAKFACGIVPGLMASTVMAMTAIYQVENAEGDYLQAVLTHDVYRYFPAGQLHQLAVIDNEGNKLPYRINAPQKSVQENRETLAVPFYPVTAGTPSENLRALGHTSVRVGDETITVNIEPNARPTTADSAPVDFYLLDLSAVKDPIDNLVVDWQADAKHQYLEVEVSGTRDLQQWTKVSRHTLLQLQKDDQQLLHNKIPLNFAANEYPYLRLALMERAGEEPQLRELRVEVSGARVALPVVEHWQISGGPAQTTTSVSATGTKAAVAAWEYVRDDFAPVQAVGVVLGEQGYGDLIRLYSRATPAENWQPVYQGIWFNLHTGAGWQHNDPLAIHPNSDAYWRLELASSARAFANPELLFQRSPEVLQFIASQAAPYRLAFADDSTSQSIAGNIFAQLVQDARPDWVEVELKALNPDIGNLHIPAQELNWTLWLFWGSLVLAVCVLLGFAVRLIKQMA